MRVNFSYTKENAIDIGLHNPGGGGNKALYRFKVGKYFSSDPEFNSEDSAKEFNDKELKEWFKEKIYQYYRDKE